MRRKLDWQNRVKWSTQTEETVTQFPAEQTKAAGPAAGRGEGSVMQAAIVTQQGAVSLAPPDRRLHIHTVTHSRAIHVIMIARIGNSSEVKLQYGILWKI